mgnify:CR=1 FL=1
MLYLKFYLVSLIMNLLYVLVSYLIYAFILKAPIEKVVIGLVKVLNLKTKASIFEIGLIPIGSSLQFQDGYTEGLSAAKDLGMRFLNILILLGVIVALIIPYGVTVDGMLASFQYFTLQLSMEEFILLHGDWDTREIGMYYFWLTMMMAVFQLIRRKPATKSAENFNMISAIVPMIISMVLIIRLLVDFWGR